MKLILKRDVANLGDAGDIVEVADGYGNNFLVPRGLAMRATKGAAKDAEALAAARRKREARSRADAEDLASRLEAATVVVTAKAGEDGTLYGSVGNREVAAAIREQLGVTVDRRRMPMERPLKSVGEHAVAVRVHSEVTANVRVEVSPEP